MGDVISAISLTVNAHLNAQMTSMHNVKMLLMQNKWLLYISVSENGRGEKKGKALQGLPPDCRPSLSVSAGIERDYNTQITVQ